MKTPSVWMIAAACFIAPASVAHASSAYDGSWDLAFVTQTGSCDPSHNFTVNITDDTYRGVKARKLASKKKDA